MRTVLDCINAFIPLLSTEYELVLGRKGVAVTLRILFDKKDCFHLMGLQYLVDRPELSRNCKNRGVNDDKNYIRQYM
ncbi:PBECR4 domain-containing protein [Agathobacter sp.]